MKGVGRGGGRREEKGGEGKGGRRGAGREGEEGGGG